MSPPRLWAPDPDDLDDPAADLVPEPRGPLWTVQRVLGLFVVLALLLGGGMSGLGLVIDQLGDSVGKVQAEQAAGRERGYVNRATSCRVLVLLGVKFAPDDGCLDPEVVAYYDPNELRPTPAFACTVLAALGELDRVPDCDGE